MLFRRILYTVVALSLTLVPKICRAQVQTYYYSGPITGDIDAELTPDGLGEGGLQVSFVSINETFYYNPTAQTMEQVGTLSLANYSGTFNIVPPPYLYPPTGSGSAAINVGNSGSLSFDLTDYEYIGGNFFFGPLLFPVSGYGVFDGQLFATNWTIEIPTLEMQIASYSPTALTFSETAPFREVPGSEVIDGLRSGNDDDNYFLMWNEQSIVAPEGIADLPDGTSSLPLAALSFSVMAFWQRRMRK